MKLKRFFHTVRYLKPIQIMGQISRKIQNHLPFPMPKPPKSKLFLPSASFSPPPPPGMQENRQATILAGEFTFINQKKQIGWSPDWSSPECSRLWLYNLHYFEWIWALDYSEAKKAIKSWIAQHQPGKNMVGWEPYPLSLRLQNWTLGFYLRFYQKISKETDFKDELNKSLLLQGKFLRRNTEKHLLGNHYFDNGATLLLLGSIFTGKEPSRWLDTGKKILNKQIPEQILDDGTHFERSPMYHCRITYLLLLLFKYGEDPIRETVQALLPQVITAINLLTHPDGEIALFNDSALGIYNKPSQLISWAKQLGIRSYSTPQEIWSLPDAGYFGWRDEGENYLICDAGDLAPDYIPGHAHGDIFSYELSLAGKRIIVDTGLYEYPAGKMRDLCRSTAAHNTVEINQTDQAEFWDSFRVAQRGHPRDISYATTQGGFRLEGWHDGYCRLEGKPRHHRRFIFRAHPFSLEINDQIQAQRTVEAASFIHLHPQVNIIQKNQKIFHLVRANVKIELEFFGDGTIHIKKGAYCPYFGCSFSNQILIMKTKGDFLHFGYRIRML